MAPRATGNTGTARLNKYLQAKGRLTSLSWLEWSTGTGATRVWHVICKIDGVPYGESQAAQKYVAKDAASDLAWTRLSAEDP